MVVKGTRVKINENMNIQEQEYEEYIGLEGVVIDVEDLRLPFPYLVEFSQDWLVERELSFDRKEFDVLENSIRKV